METLHPDSKAEVAEMLAGLSAEGTRTQIVGGRRHMDRTPARETDAELWTTQLDRVVAYDPAEMIAVVEAGKRVRELQAVLAEGDQEWPVDAHPEATVGGVIAAGVTGMRRLRTGLMRDTVVELELVTGDGRLIRSGARTVKNVTGFDVQRLVTGSLGSLGVIAQVALKVHPRPKVRRALTFRAGGVDLAESLLAGVPLPAAVIAEPDHIELILEGWPEEVDEQTEAARAVSAGFEIHEDLPVTRPDERWPEAPIVGEAAVTPTRIAMITQASDRWRALIGVGLVWFPFEDEDRWSRVRAVVTEQQGTMTRIRGGGDPAGTGVPDAGISARLLGSFDPAGILS
jgi:glycolate oxidase FAD binding subunit